MSNVTIATLQLNSGNDVAANQRSITHYITEAAQQGAKLICMPENACLMPANKAEATQHAALMHNHPMVAPLLEAARRHSVWLSVGSVQTQPEEQAEDARLYNRHLLIAPDGTIHSHYDKVHLYNAELGTADSSGGSYHESSTYQPGQHAVLAQTALANIGLSICYDVRFPHMFRRLAKAGAQILLIPAAFTKVTGEKHWHILLRARAIETGCFVIAAAQMGNHPGNRQTYGHSLVIAPDGRILADAEQQKGVMLATIDLCEVEAARSAIPSLQHDRMFIVKKSVDS